MLSARACNSLVCLLILAACAVLSGCAQPPSTTPEAPPPPQEELVAPADQPQPQPTKVAEIPAPTPAEATEAVRRIYGEAVTPDGDRKPGFIVGDFNGDFSVDIAVVVKPVEERLGEINHELANWIIGDPVKVALPDPRMMIRRDEPKPGRPIVEGIDTLLAIIHGHGARGWRDAEATQTYLLRNAAARDMKTQAKKELFGAYRGKKLPPLIGDSIGGTLAGEVGFLYFTGAKYAWYNPRLYEEEIARRTAH